ncbi:MAG: methyltransferase domain-containing protein [Myxococcota bacterium]
MDTTPSPTSPGTPTPTAPISKYPLGTDRAELERLHLQHRLWSDAAHALWKRAGILPGARVLDVGAGPGAATMDLAELVTSSGAVHAVDESERFVDHVRTQATARRVEQVTAHVGDVHALDALPELAEASFDLAYARWVLCFTASPAKVVAGIARLLAPGGALCVHDYFDYTRMTCAPRRAGYTRIVEATARSWRDNGGDPDVVARLPRLVREAGLVLEPLEVHQRIARPGDTMWHWAASWWRSYVPRLVAMGYASEADAAAIFADLDAMTRSDDFLVLPPVYELIARRPLG